MYHLYLFFFSWTKFLHLSKAFSPVWLLSKTAVYSRYIILSGSLSSFQIFSDPFYKHLILQRILLIINIWHLSGISVVFIRIPCHTDIKDNDLVDRAVKQATSKFTITCSPPYPSSDLKRLLQLLNFNGTTFSYVNAINLRLKVNGQHSPVVMYTTT